MHEDHVSKRETPLGRWLPVSFYSVNFILWIVTGILAGAWKPGFRRGGHARRFPKSPSDRLPSG